MIQAMFGLSPAEARVAKLLSDGLTPSEAAERLCMRPNTLRGYMKSIFVKLDVHRQSELVRLVCTTAGLLRGAGEAEAPPAPLAGR
jgi:DNA-binding CsgD family transcriptional regulator